MRISEQFVELKAKEACGFFNTNGWARLMRFRRHLTAANRSHLRASLTRLISEAERKIAELT